MSMNKLKNSTLNELTKQAIEVIQAPGASTVIGKENPLPNVVRNLSDALQPIELFHFGFSICSHKVRAVLAELNLTFGSNQYAGPTKYENYSPEYVRLRLQSDAAKSNNFVHGYTGGSSVDSEGFDPLVVPTLVDNNMGRVLADSKLICLYLVDQYGMQSDLLPPDLRDLIINQMDVVDRTPHVALLYGSSPTGDTRPIDIQTKMPGIHKIKFKKINGYMASVRGEPELVKAYKAKIAKEEAAEQFVVNSFDMQDALNLTEKLLSDLDKQLEASTGDWLFDNRFTLADLVWGVSLLRLDYLGKSYLWERKSGHSKVKAYLSRLQNRRCLINAVLKWPGSGKRIQTN